MQIKLPFSRRREVTPETWTVCPSCESQIFNRQLERNLRVCPTCGHHFRMGIGQRIELLLDDGSFVEHDAGLESGDPLGFHDQKPYVDRLEASRVKTGLREAAVWGIGTIEGQRVAIGLFDFHFMGGSMGSVVGEKLARCFEAALAERIPADRGQRLRRGAHAGGDPLAAPARQDDRAARPAWTRPASRSSASSPTRPPAACWPASRRWAT